VEHTTDGQADAPRTDGPDAPDAAAPADLTGPVPPVPAASPRRSRRPVVAGLAAVVLVVAAVGAVVVSGSDEPDEPDADEALARAQEAIAAAGSFRMSSDSEDRSVSGEVDGPGTGMVLRIRADLEVAGDDWRLVADGGDWAEEAVSVGGSIHTRFADEASGLDAEPWVVLPPEGSTEAPALEGDEMVREFLAISGLDLDGDGEVDSDVGGAESVEALAVPTLAGYYVLGLGGPVGAGTEGGSPAVPLPDAFAATFGAFEDAEVVEETSAGLTVSATRSAPDELAGALDIPLPDGRFEIDLDHDGLPTALRLTLDGEATSHDEDVTFSDWGTEIAIAVPDGDVDETPWIDEQAVAAIGGTVTPLAPTAVPDGLELVELYPMAAEEATEMGGEPCDQLNLVYEPPLVDPAALDEWYATGDYLDVYLLPVDCALDYDDAPFAPGEFGAAPSRQVGGLVEVLVGETVVQIDTTYRAELPGIVASIQPFDLAAEVARLAIAGEEWWNEEMATG
jgi:hypothetical protein